MIEVLKRYGIAFLILLFTIGLMLIGTHLVKNFGDTLFEEDNVTIEPRGEKIVL